MTQVPGRLPQEYIRPLKAYIWLMLQKNPAGRPTAIQVIKFLKSLVNEQVSGEIEPHKPQGESLGTKTTIKTFSTFQFTT